MQSDKTTHKTPEMEQLLRDMFAAAVEAALPQNNMSQFIPPSPKGKTVVIGAGKASVAMARALEALWPEPLSGLIVTPHGTDLGCQHIEVVEANHPVPDEAGENASKRILDLVTDLNSDDLVISLISGGGSSLLSFPGHGITLADKQAINQALLKSGAAIDEMNCVRKHLSGIKGGRLAHAAYPAKVVTLTISDVPGDDPSTIASGPTVVNTTTREQAIDIINRYNIELPDNVTTLLNSEHAQTPDPNAASMTSLTTHVICKPQQSLEAAAKVASDAGYNVLILGDAIEGEAREVGKVLAGIAKQVHQYNQPVAAPAVLISGGETTVTIKAKGGRGGRNAECLLGFAEAVVAYNNISGICCDTDGIDGTESNAGVIWTSSVNEQAKAQSLKIAHYLDNNNAWSFFDKTNGLVNTGPTHTNVNDFRAMVITPATTQR